MNSKIIRDFAPAKDNNRNSEGAFITLKNGNIMFAYSRYGGEGDDDGAAADIYASVSSDGGESFGEPYPLITHTEMNADNIMSASFMRMANGDIGLFFLAKTEIVNCLCYLIRSGDEGKTWSKPVLCSEKSGYFVVNNDRPVRTKSGRILIPAAKHGTVCFSGSKFLDDILPGVLYVFASDDDGFTWYKLFSGLTLPYCAGCTTGVQEPGLLELPDGRLWCYIRNDSGRQYETFSDDDGASWDEPTPSRFTSAISPLSTLSCFLTRTRSPSAICGDILSPFTERKKYSSVPYLSSTVSYPRMSSCAIMPLPAHTSPTTGIFAITSQRLIFPSSNKSSISIAGISKTLVMSIKFLISIF